MPLRAVLMLASVKNGDPADFSVASNVCFVDFLVDLGILNRRGSVGSPVIAAPLALAMFREDVSTIFSCSVMGGGAGSLREVPPHLFYGTQRTADLETEANVELDGIMVENNFKMYAYTMNQLQVRLLGLFCRIIACLPNMVVGQISAEPVLKAMRRGIRAENILAVLKEHCPSQNVEESRQRRVRCARQRTRSVARSGKTIIPGSHVTVACSLSGTLQNMIWPLLS